MADNILQFEPETPEEDSPVLQFEPDGGNVDTPPPVVDGTLQFDADPLADPAVPEQDQDAPSVWDSLKALPQILQVAPSIALGESVRRDPDASMASQTFNEGFVQSAISAPLESGGELFEDVFGVGEDIAGFGRMFRELSRVPEEDLTGSFFSEGLPRALGQTTGFAAGGGAGRALGAKTWIAPLLQGVATGGQSGREDALAAGATDAQIDIAFYANGALGASEALPIVQLFDKIDDATGGFLGKKIQSKVGRTVVGGLEQGVEEALQETFQTFGGNVVAADIAAYDPDRNYMDYVTDSAAEGGAVGFMLGSMATALGIRLRNEPRPAPDKAELDKAQADLEAEIGAPLQDIAGDFTKLSDRYFDLVGEKVGTEIRVNERSQLDDDQQLRQYAGLDREVWIAEMELESPIKDNTKLESVKSIAGDAEIQGDSATFSINGQNFAINQVKDRDGFPLFELSVVNEAGDLVLDRYETMTEVDQAAMTYMEKGTAMLPRTPPSALFKPQIPRLLQPPLANSTVTGASSTTPKADERIEAYKNMLNTELEGNVELEERLARTPVTMAMGRYKLAKENFLANVEKSRKDLKNQLEVGDYTEAQREKQIKNWEGQVEDRIKYFDWAIKEEKKMAKEVKRLLAEMHNTFKMDGNILVGTFARDSRNMGEIVTFLRTREVNGEKVFKVNYLMELNLKDMLSTKTFGNKELFEQRRAAAMETVMHEMGHVFVFTKFKELTTKVKSGKASNTEEALLNGILLDYRQWVIDNLNSPAKNFVQSYFGPNRQADYLDRRFPVKGIDSLALRNRTVPEVFKGEDINYLFSFDEFFAEQFAKGPGQLENMLDPDQKGFYKDILAGLKKLYEGQKGKFKISSSNFEDFIRLLSVEGKLKAEQEKLAGQTTDIYGAIKKLGGLDTAEMDPLGSDVDNFNKFYDIGLNILQIAERNPHITSLQTYVETLRQWKNEVNTNLAVADTRLKEWRNLSKKDGKALADLLYGESMGRLKNGKFLKKPRFFTIEEKAAFGLSDRAVEIYESIREDFRKSLDEMESVLVQAKKEIFSNDPAQSELEVKEVQTEFANLRAQPYFPLMRFGKFTVKIVARRDGVEYKGRTYKEGQVIDFESFEKEGQQKKDFGEKKLKLSQADFIVSAGLLQDPDYSLQGMPLSLLNQLEERLGDTVSVEQKAKIQELKKDILPFRSFKNQFIKRKRVEGFSQDAMRSYANYMWGFGNHLARIKYEPSFQQVMKNLDDSKKVIETLGKDATKRGKILDHVRNHHKYVMEPANELIGLRSAAFVYYLGFNVKSAVVNMTQIPLVTYPYLGNKFGDGKAIAQITRAYKTWTGLYTNPKKVDPEISELVARGLEQGWLDESLATELATAASENNLDANLAKQGINAVPRWITEKSALMFHVAEKANRHITAIAAYRLARAEGQTKDMAVKTARIAVEKSQYEYARWNRPRFMRGKVGGTVFVFFNYLQNTLEFIAKGDGGSYRMLGMLLLMSGLQGLPFGENIMDLVDAYSSWLKKKSGTKDPQTDVRTELRAFIKEMNVNPDLVLHGIGSSSFGMANIGEFMGWPIPSADLSGSISMGRIVPGTELLRPGEEKSVERLVTEGIGRAGGAVAGGILDTLKAIVDNNPDEWKRWERALPAAMRQISKGARLAVRGEETTRGGRPIAEFDMTDPKDVMEVGLQMFGFTPTETSRGWQGYIAEKQAVGYYSSWKASLLLQFNHTFETEDSQARSKVRKEIRKYNKAVPFPELKIGYEVLRSSRGTYERNRNFNERSIDVNNSSRRLSESIQEVYETEGN